MLTRLYQIDTTTALIGVAGGVVAELFVPDAFFFLFMILVFANLVDWNVGRRAARAKQIYNRKKSRDGLASKGGQLAILLVVRSLEYVMSITDLPSTLGIASSMFCLVLILEDLESIDKHRVELGARPTPLLSALIRRVNSLTGGESREDNTGPPKGVSDRRSK